MLPRVVLELLAYGSVSQLHGRMDSLIPDSNMYYDAQSTPQSLLCAKAQLQEKRLSNLMSNLHITRSRNDTISGSSMEASSTWQGTADDMTIDMANIVRPPPRVLIKPFAMRGSVAGSDAGTFLPPRGSTNNLSIPVQSMGRTNRNIQVDADLGKEMAAELQDIKRMMSRKGTVQRKISKFFNTSITTLISSDRKTPEISDFDILHTEQQLLIDHLRRQVLIARILVVVLIVLLGAILAIYPCQHCF